MREVLILSKRNLQNFFRDRMNVFFALLSAVILYLIYLVFLADLQVQQIKAEVPGVDAGVVYGFVISWVFAGIIAVTTMSASLSGISMFVDDRVSGRFADFLVSPVRRAQITAGYILSSFAVALLLSVFTAVVGIVYLAIARVPMMSPLQMLEVFGTIVLSCALFATVSCVIAAPIKSSGAFSAAGSIVGTASGFLALAYLPAGLLPKAVASTLNALPFAQAAMLIRQPFTAPALDKLTSGDATAAQTLRSFYGMVGSVGDLQVTTGYIIVAFVVLTGVLGTVATLTIRKSIV